MANVCIGVYFFSLGRGERWFTRPLNTPLRLQLHAFYIEKNWRYQPERSTHEKRLQKRAKKSAPYIASGSKYVCKWCRYTVKNSLHYRQLYIRPPCIRHLSDIYIVGEDWFMYQYHYPFLIAWIWKRCLRYDMHCISVTCIPQMRNTIAVAVYAMFVVRLLV